MTESPTWEQLKTLEPRLVQLEQRASQYFDVTGDSFYRHLKGPVCKLIGWSRGLMEGTLSNGPLPVAMDIDEIPALVPDPAYPPADDPNEKILRSSAAYDVAYHAIYDLSAKSKRLTSGDPVARAGTPIGQWFHSWNDKGQILWQGQVVESQGESTYLVRTYSWLTGGAHAEEIVTSGQMVADHWTFYSTPEAMQHAYSQYDLKGPGG